MGKLADKMPYAMRLAKYRLTIEQVFHVRRLPVNWGLAFAKQESSFRAGIVTLSGGDGKRGGSYGLFQMSLMTARGLGFLDDATKLLDPYINATLAAQLIIQLQGTHGDANLRDIAAAYNSGKSYDRAPDSTRTVYVPHVLQYAREFRPVPIALAQ